MGDDSSDNWNYGALKMQPKVIKYRPSKQPFNELVAREWDEEHFAQAARQRSIRQSCRQVVRYGKDHLPAMVPFIVARLMLRNIHNALRF